MIRESISLEGIRELFPTFVDTCPDVVRRIDLPRFDFPLTVKSLADLACIGQGPEYFTLGRNTFYHKTALIRFLQERIRHNKPGERFIEKHNGMPLYDIQYNFGASVIGCTVAKVDAVVSITIYAAYIPAGVRKDLGALVFKCSFCGKVHQKMIHGTDFGSGDGPFQSGCARTSIAFNLVEAQDPDLAGLLPKTLRRRAIVRSPLPLPPAQASQGLEV